MEGLQENSQTEIRRRIPSNSLEEMRSNVPVPHQSMLDKVVDTFCGISTVSIVKFLCVSVTIGSLIYECYPLAEGSYFSNKHNFLNQYFVKLAWGWTMALHTPFIVLSGLQSPAKISQIFRGLVRVLVVGTAVWYCWVEIVFHRVMQVTGACAGNESSTEVRACIKAGHRWDGFDISGHCFLLIYSALLVHEELRIVSHNVNTTTVNASDDTATNTTSQIADVFIHIGDHPAVRILQKLFTVLMILLELLWMLMVMMTSIYFHVWSHKLVGTLIAIGSWHCTYNIWYKAKLSPG